MFNIKKFFGFGEVESVSVAKPAKSDAAEAAPAKTGRKGRTLSADAQAAHEAVAALLSETPQTRATIVAKLAETQRAYVDGNWQGLILRLMTQNKAKLAEGSKGRGRNVSYVRA